MTHLYDQNIFPACRQTIISKRRVTYRRLVTWGDILQRHKELIVIKKEDIVVNDTGRV